MFGELGGLPVSDTAAKAGTGLGDTYTITGSGSYVLTPNFLIDTYTGITMIEVLSEPDRLDENLGLDFLGIPGHERPRPAVRRLAALQHHQLLEHRLRRQQQLALHRRQLAGAVHGQRDLDRGAHTFRFGGDIVRQALNRFETGNGSGSFAFAGGPTTLSGGPSATSSTPSRRSCSACPPACRRA